MTASATVASVWVNYNCGVAYFVLLTLEDGSTSELRGAPMWRWLREYSPALKGQRLATPFRSLPPYERPRSEQTSFAWSTGG